MIDYIIQNFNLVTFFLALVFFILVSYLYNLIISYIRMKRSKQRVKEAEAELSKLQKQMKQKDKELEKLLSKKERE